MFAKLITVLVWGSIVAALVSCNIYSPFDSTSSDEDYVEAAQKCLHNNDYSCAVENYGKIASAELKAQKLCLVYLAKSGFTISAMVNTVKTNSSTMLGSLATALLPWDSQKSADAASAMTQCDAYSGYAGSGQTGVLLKNLSHLVDCATLLAKSDQFIGTSNADTACSTAGNRDGRITQADVNNNVGGTNAMCAADALRCSSDFNTMDTASLGTDLNDIKTAILATDNGLAAAASADAARTALDAAVTP